MNNLGNSFKIIIMFVFVLKEGQMKFDRVLQIGLRAPSIMLALSNCFQPLSVI